MSREFWWAISLIVWRLDRLRYQRVYYRKGWGEVRRKRQGRRTREQYFEDMRVPFEQKVDVSRRARKKHRLKMKMLANPDSVPRWVTAVGERVRSKRRLYVCWWKRALKAQERPPRIRPAVSREKLANRVRALLKRKLKRKIGLRTTVLIGCSVNELRAHLERQFSKTMSWSNYGTVWEIDHLLPLATFDLSRREQWRQACHYTNLRPLMRWANNRKGARIIRAAQQPQLALPM